MTKNELMQRHQTVTNYAVTISDQTSALLTQQQMLKHSKELLIANAKEHDANIATLSVALQDNKQAMVALNTVKDMNTAQSYAFIEHNLNIALDKVFSNSVRKIQLKEGVYNSKYPELRLELITENGVKRSLKTDSGHGMRQIVSLLCTLCLICVSGARRFLVLDEVLTGLSAESRAAVDDILWAFAGIGFQFVIVEHGFIAHDSYVYELTLNNGVSHVTREYKATSGNYLGKAKSDSSTPQEGLVVDSNSENTSSSQVQSQGLSEEPTSASSQPLNFNV